MVIGYVCTLRIRDSVKSTEAVVAKRHTVGPLVTLQYVYLLTAVTSESLEAHCLLPKR